jgi:hypothetical protein
VFTLIPQITVIDCCFFKDTVIKDNIIVELKCVQGSKGLLYNVFDAFANDRIFEK